MTTNKILVDTSYLVALSIPKDRNHTRAIALAAQGPDQLVLPQVVLTEVSFLLLRSGGVPAMRAFLRWVVEAEAPLQTIVLEDIHRAEQIMEQYADAQFDFVDTCLMALSERLNITQICTFDRRDFSMFRPRHTDYLELLPE